MEQLLLPCKCVRCNKKDEMELSLSGPHIKGICQHCKSYQKFVPFNVVPGVDDVKIKIWGMVGGDIGIVNMAKKDISFIDTGLNMTQMKVMHWKLYLRIRQILTHAAL